MGARGHKAGYTLHRKETEQYTAVKLRVAVAAKKRTPKGTRDSSTFSLLILYATAIGTMREL